MNTITFNDNRTQVQVEGGTIISELVDAAYANNTQVVTANCNCVGVMGALLGGGYSRMMGERGFMVDNVLSLRVVLASGELVDVTPTSHPDLWWALRGAGANFGIVTSAVFRAFPTAPAQNGAWLGSLIFADDQLEDVVAAINNLTLTSKMAIFLYYATTGAPDYTPAIIVFPFYLGNNTAEARQAFAPVLDIGPESDGTTFTPYNEVNEGSDSFCVAGNRKVSYGAAEDQLDPATWRAIWNEYTSFVDRYGGEAVGNSTVLMEAYSLGTAEQLGDSSSAYAWRSTNRFNTVAIAWYADQGLDAPANAWAGQIREHWRSTSGLQTNATYINFAFGDETLEDIYGGNVGRLQQLKGVYDPDNHFGQFFPLDG
ncbi:FAD-binding domain-containing protein [Aspergillus sclerotiicarbonarius CBS 121057]|uniref:FAD-binding domain-containing protein n=1 Tax=Aspergillus sclerotiicarbonarius (strain CBS 121057 / IBT 28362) TaxID=1448318 RepID=A0A319E439_ASPSB|nr:FAD-binding domain-containing protein [Aspergillus sclerotiicarbonarius CBS 121057]